MRLYEMTITFLYEMGFGHPFYIEYVVSDFQNIFEHHRRSFYRGLLEQVCTSDGIVCKDAGKAFYRASRGIILLYVVKIKMSRGSFYRTSSYRCFFVCDMFYICFHMLVIILYKYKACHVIDNLSQATHSIDTICL